MSNPKKNSVLGLICALLLTGVLFTTAVMAAEPDPGPVPKGMKVYVTGNTAWVTTSHEEGYVFMGGGSECDEAMAWVTAKTHNGDFVVIRVTGTDGYNDYLYSTIGGVDSVHTLVISKATFANTTYVETVIKNAEALWIAGGDQSDYYNLWKGTKVESAISYLVYTKKAVVGGTSAGMAVLGDVDYIPAGTSVISSEALANPYHTNMNYLKTDFINFIPYSFGIIPDTHWSERDRMGRTIAFMARTIKDGVRTVQQTKAIACDEGAAVCVEANGSARIFGWDGYNDYAFFLSADTTPNTCVSGQPLHWTDAVTVYKVHGYPSGTNTFNLATWTGTGGSWNNVNVINGVIDNDIQEPDL